MILYGEKSFFTFFFFLASWEARGRTKNSSYVAKKDTSIAGLRMFVAFLVFAKAPGKWMGMLGVSSYIYIMPRVQVQQMKMIQIQKGILRYNAALKIKESKAKAG